MSSKENEGYTIEQSYEDLKLGLDLGIDDVRKSLVSGLKDLSKSDMERALGSIINYPSNLKVMTKKEETFIRNLNALHGLHLKAETIAIGEIQEAQDKLRMSEELTKEEQENERKED